MNRRQRKLALSRVHGLPEPGPVVLLSLEVVAARVDPAARGRRTIHHRGR